MIAKLYHMSLYDLGQLLYGWVFGRDYWVPIRTVGTMNTTTSTEGNTETLWLSPVPQWESKPRRIRFRVPRDAYDKDY